MDTITHGIVGALIGRAFFADVGQASRPVHHSQPTAQPLDREEWRSESAATRGPAPVPPAGRMPALQGRIAIWVATLGSIFPDSDSIFDAFDATGMSVLTEHRGITHSLLLLPLWAMTLAALTRWVLRRWAFSTQGLKPLEKEGTAQYGEVETPPYQGRQSPGAQVSFLRLAVIWGVGIASHVLLDLVNSWGTMIWMPLDRTRVVWDLVFVIDSALSAVVLVPQLAAWAYRNREGSVARRMASWMLLSLGAVAVERLARATGFPFSPWVVGVASVLAAGLFLVPRESHWGFAVSRAAWCRAGVLALAGYIGLCGVAHRVALDRVKEFAGHQGLKVENVAAIPLPPSLLRWGGLIRTPEGVYEARFGVFDRRAPFFRFVADAPANRYVEAARHDPRAQEFLWFARFPSVSYLDAGGTHVVEFRDLRFFPRPSRANPFTFRVTLDAEGHVIQSGWVE